MIFTKGANIITQCVFIHRGFDNRFSSRRHTLSSHNRNYCRTLVLYARYVFTLLTAIQKRGFDGLGLT